MQSLNFNEGYKEFCINGDEKRVIRFNPTDFGIKERIEEAERRIKSRAEKMQSDNTNNIDSKLKEIIKEALNHIFNADVYDTIFGLQNPISPSDGKMLVEHVIEGIKDIITPYLEEERKKMDEKINKYVSEVQ